MSLFVHDDLIDADGKENTYRFCCPIFITDMFGTALARDADLFPKEDSNPRIRNGTLTFVSYQGRTYGITCRHVVEALEFQNSRTQQEHVETFRGAVPFVLEMQLHFFFPKDNAQIHINSQFFKAPGDEFARTFADLAIARIAPEKMNQIGREAIPLDSGNISISKLASSECGIATGYPERKRRLISGETVLSKMGMSTMIAVASFEGSSERTIRMISELSEEPDVDNLSGMSGGPIIWSNKDGWRLVGIIKDGRDMKKDSSLNQGSSMVGPVIWIDGEPINEGVFEQLIAQIPSDDAPLRDLSKILYSPERRPGEIG